MTHSRPAPSAPRLASACGAGRDFDNPLRRDATLRRASLRDALSRDSLRFAAAHRTSHQFPSAMQHFASHHYSTQRSATRRISHQFHLPYAAQRDIPLCPAPQARAPALTSFPAHRFVMLRVAVLRTTTPGTAPQSPCASQRYAPLREAPLLDTARQPSPVSRRHETQSRATLCMATIRASSHQHPVCIIPATQRVATNRAASLCNPFPRASLISSLRCTSCRYAMRHVTTRQPSAILAAHRHASRRDSPQGIATLLVSTRQLSSFPTQRVALRRLASPGIAPRLDAPAFTSFIFAAHHTTALIAAALRCARRRSATSRLASHQPHQFLRAAPRVAALCASAIRKASCRLTAQRVAPQTISAHQHHQFHPATKRVASLGSAPSRTTSQHVSFPPPRRASTRTATRPLAPRRLSSFPALRIAAPLPAPPLPASLQPSNHATPRVAPLHSPLQGAAPRTVAPAS